MSDFICNITVHLSYETRTQEIFCQHILDFIWHRRQGVIPKSALLERQISTTYATPICHLQLHGDKFGEL